MLLVSATKNSALKRRRSRAAGFSVYILKREHYEQEQILPLFKGTKETKYVFISHMYTHYPLKKKLERQRKAPYLIRCTAWQQCCSKIEHDTDKSLKSI